MLIAGPFCTYFGIKVDSTVRFQAVDQEGGMLTLDIAKTVKVGRAGRGEGEYRGEVRFGVI